MGKLRKTLVLGLVLAGLFLSVMNFIPQIQASSIQGTTTNLSNPDLLYYYFCVYGPEYMHGHWLEGMDYCLDTASNCGIYVY